MRPLITPLPWRRLLLLALIIGACSDSPTAPADLDLDDDGLPNEADTCPTAPETVNGVFDADGCPDTPVDLYQTVRVDVEAYWSATFAQIPLTYTSISTFHGYTVPTNSPCGPLVLNNAFYCPANGGVYYDAVFLESYLSSVGDMAPAFIVSHEIGHHVSWSLGWTPLITQKENELQADCFGGAWARSADDRGLLESGDLEEAVVALILVGDPDYTWFDPVGHGTAQQRVTAFAIGYDQGPSGCTSQGFFDAFPVNAP